MGFKDGVQTLSRDGKLRRQYLPGLGPSERAFVSYFSIYPNLLLTLHPDYMVTVTLWPKATNRTELICEWHFHSDEIARPGFEFQDAVDFWEVTNREEHGQWLLRDGMPASMTIHTNTGGATPVGVGLAPR